MLINLIGFQLCWFGLVYYGNLFIPIALVLLTIHLLFISTKANEYLLIFTVTFIGSIVDYLFVLSDIFIFDSVLNIPLWLITLWACFAATLGHSLQYLKHSFLTQFLVGGLLAPLSYIAGNKLNAVEFSYSISITYLLLAITWALLMVLFFRLDNWIIRRVQPDA